jgi:hypothetical protein
VQKNHNEDVAGEKKAVYFFIWSGENFPYLYRMAVESVLLNVPNANVVIYVVGRPPQTRHFQELSQLQRVAVCHLNPSDLFKLLPQNLGHVANVYRDLPSSSVAAQSNILRYCILFLYGGVYLDFDTFTLKPIHELKKSDTVVGEELVWRGDEARVAGSKYVYLHFTTWAWALSWVGRRLDARYFQGKLQLAKRWKVTEGFWGKYQANNAVMVASAGTAFIERVLVGLKGTRNDVRYSTGPTLISKMISEDDSDVEVRRSTHFYSIPPGESFRFFEDHSLELSNEVAVIHYVGSNHAELLQVVTPSLLALNPQSVIGRIAREIEARRKTLYPTSSASRLANS